MHVHTASPVGPRLSSVVGSIGVALLTLATLAGTATAQRLDKPRQAWLATYRLLLVPEELTALKALKGSADLEEFERIFWARRSPDPAQKDSPVKAGVTRARAIADQRFGESGRKGSETGCGQVFLLAGDADEVTGLGLRSTFETRSTRVSPATRNSDPSARDQALQSAAKDGARRAETWIYKSRPDRAFKLPGGDLRISFDDGCEFDENPRTIQELSRVAATRVIHPEIGYRFTAAGLLRPLSSVAPTSSGATTLLDGSRADFSLSFEMKLQVPTPVGGYSAGILRGEPGAILPAQFTPGRPVDLDVTACAVPASGDPVTVPGRRVQAVAKPDGSFLTTVGLALPPGTYDVAVAVLEPASGRAAVAHVPFDVPDYAKGPLAIGPLMVLTESDNLGAAERIDPYAAFIVGREHFYARPGNVLAPADSLRLLLLVQNAGVSSETKKATLRAAFTVLKDGRPVARGSEQVFDTPGAAASVGPIPLADFAAGQYLARVEVNDDVTKTRVVREAAFIVTPPAGK
ncbi:MAG TPA: GWxTD domain-containing protein [Vicinamibacterales bacterium]|jgi:GWxTD domain-containing protein